MKTKIIGDLGKSPVVENPVIDKNDDRQSLSIPQERNESSSSDGEIEAPVTKPKKVLSDKQKQNLIKGREVRNEKRKERIDSRKIEEELKKQELENKIVKKAIAVKKKQIRKEKILELSENETEDEKPPHVRRVAPQVTSSQRIFPQGNKKTVPQAPVPQAPVKPRIIFF